jgi:predicted dehydrogenase
MTAHSKMLRTAVVGLGPMGMHHVRAAADMENTKLVAVVDIDHDRADEAAKTFQCLAFYNVTELVGLVDAVTIATPPAFHAVAAVPLLDAGINCLIEKPLAMTEADCLGIIQAAGKNPVVVGVGQVERFNPATEALFAANIPSHDIRRIDVQRLSPAGGRQVPVDVVSDMMIHDLEIVLALKKSEVVAVVAQGVLDDWAKAELTFADGTSARLMANRKADTRIRDLALHTTQGDYHLDFMGRTVTHTTHGITHNLNVSEHDALRAEVSDFLAAVRTNTNPRVTAQHALRAMRVAWRIIEAIK